MKNKRYLLLSIMLLVIDFATITTIININGTVGIKTNNYLVTKLIYLQDCIIKQ